MSLQARGRAAREDLHRGEAGVRAEAAEEGPGAGPREGGGQDTGGQGGTVQVIWSGAVPPWPHS